MKTLLVVFLVLVCSNLFAQYEYAAIIHEIRIGGKASFSFGTENKNDSANFYPRQRTIVDALNYADKKGWEPIEIFEGNGLLTAIIRRKRTY